MGGIREGGVGNSTGVEEFEFRVGFQAREDTGASKGERGEDAGVTVKREHGGDEFGDVGGRSAGSVGGNNATEIVGNEETAIDN